MAKLLDGERARQAELCAAVGGKKGEEEEEAPEAAR